MSNEVFKAPEHKFVAADEHESLYVTLADAWPQGRLQRQLDRIEEKLDRLLDTKP